MSTRNRIFNLSRPPVEAGGRIASSISVPKDFYRMGDKYNNEKCNAGPYSHVQNDFKSDTQDPEYEREDIVKD